MRRKDYLFSKTKNKLREYEHNGRKSVCWRLSKGQVEFIEQSMGKEVKPYLFEVQTRTFVNPEKLNSVILKKLHYASKKGRRSIVLKLRKKEMRVLDNYGIRYKCIKHEIILNP